MEPLIVCNVLAAFFLILRSYASIVVSWRGLAGGFALVSAAVLLLIFGSGVTNLYVTKGRYRSR